MKRKMILGLVAGLLAIALAGGVSGDPPVARAADNAKTPGLQTEKADYRGLLTVAEVQSITGYADLRLKAIDAKKSGEAADLTFSTSEGHRIVMVQVLNGRDFDMYYSAYRSQDFKAWPDAFWGPREANPPSMFWFRKGDLLILVTSDLDDKGKPYIVPDLFVAIAEIIKGRL